MQTQQGGTVNEGFGMLVGARCVCFDAVVVVFASPSEGGDLFRTAVFSTHIFEVHILAYV